MLDIIDLEVTLKKVEIIKDACISCGLCIQMNNEVFDYDDDGKSKVMKEMVDDSNITNIADICPTGAIIITE